LETHLYKKLNVSVFFKNGVRVFTANTLPRKVFSKIGNKVFIPAGVKNLFPKIEPLAKHIAP